jgi:pyruvate-ferredoxin/flavodoxin oxidoreductase
MGGKDEQTLRAFLEAEAYDGPSIIIAYSHCIAHGIHMPTALQNQKAAVDSGQWLLYRYNPDLAADGKNPLILDSRPPKLPVTEYLRMENRFRMLEMSNPQVAKTLFAEAQEDVDKRRAYYEYLANRPFNTNGAEEALEEVQN